MLRRAGGGAETTVDSALIRGLVAALCVFRLGAFLGLGDGHQAKTLPHI
jgi:ABC-type antimicrobial peptide transport system permease subunit